MGNKQLSLEAEEILLEDFQDEELCSDIGSLKNPKRA